MATNQGVKIHYLGDTYTEIEHYRCAGQMKLVQDFHMNSNGWADIGYNFAVCQHGYVFEGRGLNAQNAANGNTALNRNHFAVLVFTAKRWFGGTPHISQACITGIQDVIAYLRRHGAGWEIAGHRDGYRTECPGDLLYNLVLNGTLDPGVLWDGGTHIVTAGETIDSISLDYNVPEGYIIEVNNLSAPYTVRVGQRLEIPARGMPLGEEPPPDNTFEFQPFPGTEWFRSRPHHPIIRAMGERLVARGCGRYPTGPGPQWTDADRESYRAWQRMLGFTGDDADGWPGATSWDQLAVPFISVLPLPVGYEPFPGAEWFRGAPNSAIVTAMGRRLVEEGCGEYTSGPGPQWTATDQASYRNWQLKLGYAGVDADGWPGEASWARLEVPRTSTGEYQAFPGTEWFHDAPYSPIVTAMGQRLVAEGCSEYEHGPGPQWTEVDRDSYRLWQLKLGYSGTDADGWPGPSSWAQLRVPRNT
nr:peptidoglycan-binding protein [Streptomyces sp. 8K308]